MRDWILCSGCNRAASALQGGKEEEEVVVEGWFSVGTAKERKRERRREGERRQVS